MHFVGYLYIFVSYQCTVDETYLKRKLNVQTPWCLPQSVTDSCSEPDEYISQILSICYE
jgi:hypothetical protein